MTETKKNVKEEDVKSILPNGKEEFKEEKVEEPKVEEPKMADTIALAVENGLVAIDPTLEEDVAVLEKIEETEDTIKAKLPDGEVIEIDKEAIVNPECNDADHISRAKVLDVINTTFAKYETKVVLAMSEVRDIINTITNAVKE